jgi:hypothetical protein
VKPKLVQYFFQRLQGQKMRSSYFGLLPLLRARQLTRRCQSLRTPVQAARLLVEGLAEAGISLIEQRFRQAAGEIAERESAVPNITRAHCLKERS